MKGSSCPLDRRSPAMETISVNRLSPLVEGVDVAGGGEDSRDHGPVSCWRANGLCPGIGGGQGVHACEPIYCITSDPHASERRPRGAGEDARAGVTTSSALEDVTFGLIARRGSGIAGDVPRLPRRRMIADCRGLRHVGGLAPCAASASRARRDPPRAVRPVRLEGSLSQTLMIAVLRPCHGARRDDRRRRSAPALLATDGHLSGWDDLGGPCAPPCAPDAMGAGRPASAPRPGHRISNVRGCSQSNGLHGSPSPRFGFRSGMSPST